LGDLVRFLKYVTLCWHPSRHDVCKSRAENHGWGIDDSHVQDHGCEGGNPLNSHNFLDKCIRTESKFVQKLLFVYGSGSRSFKSTTLICAFYKHLETCTGARPFAGALRGTSRLVKNLQECKAHDYFDVMNV
jgi:hypothetical protein